MTVNSLNFIQFNKLNLDKPSSINNSQNIEVGFGDYLKNAIDNVSNLQNDAKIATEKLATGEIEDIHSVMIAVEKSEIALQYTMAIRNKIIDAYNEIMRMQV